MGGRDSVPIAVCHRRMVLANDVTSPVHQDGDPVEDKEQNNDSKNDDDQEDQNGNNEGDEDGVNDGDTNDDNKDVSGEKDGGENDDETENNSENIIEDNEETNTDSNIQDLSSSKSLDETNNLATNDDDAKGDDHKFEENCHVVKGSDQDDQDKTLKENNMADEITPRERREHEIICDELLNEIDEWKADHAISVFETGNSTIDSILERGMDWKSEMKNFEITIDVESRKEIEETMNKFQKLTLAEILEVASDPDFM